ncbi:hypothetical protein QE152_g9939 [Popillia japonica]|uniref:HTH psq-type domain-containing protein n=1 Tax=Popillia japonica TaxID=7064 RepID=A0AAW1LT14_POPJA
MSGNKRKCLTITKKVKILTDIKKDIAAKYGIAPNSLSTIWEHRDSILQQDDTTNKAKRYRTCVYDKDDEAVLKKTRTYWIRSKHWMAG